MHVGGTPTGGNPICMLFNASRNGIFVGDPEFGAYSHRKQPAPCTSFFCRTISDRMLLGIF